MMLPRSLLYGAMLMAGIVSAQDEFDEFSMVADDSWNSEFELESQMPQVLTAARLKQPKAEVPASVTVIEADQIRLWGVRTLPELMKFVPGMFVGHADNENNASVTYHTSNPNIMRRLQVLIDGRSVYKSAIATVVWDDIPLALEDIARIEVTRGPNAAMYGANSFLGVINIVTKHPADTQGTLVSAYDGNKGIRGGQLRHGFEVNGTHVRISAAMNGDHGFDGLDPNAERNITSDKDELRDSRQHGFINAAINRRLSDSSELDLQFGYKNGTTEIRQLEDDFQVEPPDKETSNWFAWGKWQKDFSATHQSHLQVYVQDERQLQPIAACIPSYALDPSLTADLRSIRESNEEWSDLITGQFYKFNDGSDDGAAVAGVIGAIDAGASAEDLSAALSGALGRPFVLSEQDLALTKTFLAGIPDRNTNITELACGDTNWDLNQQRIDIEWQDTIRWNDQFRTVSGISLRQDAATSETYFDGRVSNETLRLFANAEYRPWQNTLFNLGGMYEYEALNDHAFSPRLAMNYLVTPQQSVRLVASQAVRSPDLLESKPDYSFTIDSLSAGDGELPYFSESQASYYLLRTADEDEKGLVQEKITSFELGYFLHSELLELDIKVFHEELRDLISDPITLEGGEITNDNEADVDGAELQLNAKLSQRLSSWLAYSYVDVDNRHLNLESSPEEAISAEKLERRLSSENSVVASLMYQGDAWHSSVSYFFQDSRHIKSKYERWQLKLAKAFTIKQINAEISYFIQHNREPEMPINYSSQLHNSPNIYYGQLKLEF